MDATVRLLMAILYLSLLSCGKKPVTNDPEDKLNPPITDGEDIEQFYRDTKRIELSCDENLCPQGIFFVVSRRFSAGANNYSYCSGLMVSTDELVVPSDCLPTRLQRQDKSCEDSVLAVDYRSKDLFKCQEVTHLGVEKENPSLPSTWKGDYVVLKFESLPTRRNFLIPARLGLQENRQYTLWSYEYEGLDQTAKLKPRTCFIQYKNYVQPLGDNRLSPSLSLSACLESDPQLKHQNLGGVVFRERGFGRYNALGMVSSVLNQLPGALGKADSFKGAAIVQNFSCFDYFLKSRNRSLPKECQISLEERIVKRERARQLILDKNSEQFQRDFNFVKEEYETLDMYMRWQVQVDDLGRELNLSPRIGCFHRTDEWLDDIRRSRSFEYREPIEFTTYKVSPFLQADGTIKHEMKPVDFVAYRLTFSPRRLERRGYSDVDGFRSIGTVPEVPSCK